MAADGLSEPHLDEWTTELPRGGLHVDMADRSLEFSVARDVPDIVNRVGKAWADRKTTWHRDQYESQLDRAGGLLRFPSPSYLAMLTRCRQILLAEQRFDPAKTITMLMQHEREEGTDLEVNPWALRNDRIELSQAERAAILDDAIEAVTLEQNAKACHRL